MTKFRSIQVGGLRGFDELQKIDLALPDGAPGSGLTIIVGANNSGKSTLIEAMRALAQHATSSFSSGKRNAQFGDKVQMSITDADDNTKELASIEPGGSQTFWKTEEISELDLLVVPSRRGFNAFFNKTTPIEREFFSSQYGIPPLRSQLLDSQFASRLFKINDDVDSKREFNKLLAQVVHPTPTWTIDLEDSGQYYLNFLWQNGQSHTSEGLGEGIVSLISILDGIYDAKDDSLVVIDEPELSLHPQLQRRLREVISQFACDHQVIYSTHSPYFIDWGDLANGAKIIRSFKDGKDGVRLREADPNVVKRLSKLKNDLFNPHTLGLDAVEVFFLEDNVILTEGQEDVVFFKKIDEVLGDQMAGSFFGWGSGGAEKMGILIELLESMGYKKIVEILDGDKVILAEKYRKQFPNCHFEVIAADDIRTKPAVSPRPEKIGLFDNNKQFRREFESDTKKLYDRVNAYLS
ncbi:ATP-binding protein [Rhodococcus sp. BP-252]|uniref:ATP-dependent nuclease n=1 Tax=unclassified Rhodococcus (in: high G+C Gram-positive bacteria) TaxID=192944 RepID=UPI001C9BA1FB|nr:MULTISPECIES: ATP-binding protein [unclassified Rhodococcus (in: high G+C Gram-positive bacteria)]MBY6413343.1 ATP-binding protein [Rhodococcus sp. BP-320]MBY6418053.1 ATP-binding protein [Rhodococcus sp. BP-321]MBY6422257.1 ATP-binding protein [Rhodococcus sp. BP-324]MBY6428102.1 ATP-binding protein [Rhodococcus sp. BP-323]MBY6433264.1 ATP-binding protein [Rhodococcus sp. BP-322]